MVASRWTPVLEPAKTPMADTPPVRRDPEGPKQPAQAAKRQDKAPDKAPDKVPAKADDAQPVAVEVVNDFDVRTYIQVIICVLLVLYTL